MVEKMVVLKNEEGLHARPASILAKEAMKFTSNFRMYKGTDRTKVYQPKSILSIMTVGALKGERLTIIAEGADEEVAIKRLVYLFDSKFEV